jgi:hypothetical protein
MQSLYMASISAQLHWPESKLSTGQVSTMHATIAPRLFLSGEGTAKGPTTGSKAGSIRISRGLNRKETATCIDRLLYLVSGAVALKGNPCQQACFCL